MTASISKFDHLTQCVRFVRNAALRTLQGKDGPQHCLSEDLEYIARTLCHRAEGWMSASFDLQWANWATKALELALLETLEEFGDEARNAFFSGISPSEVEAALDRRAATIIRTIAAEAMNKIYQSVETSSNPLTIIESRAQHNAARKALEEICGVSRNRVLSSAAIDDLFDGFDRRQAERVAAARKVVRRIQYFKKDRCDGGTYRGHALNSEGELLDVREWTNITRKGDALTAVSQWVDEIRKQQGGSHIAVDSL